MGFTSDSAREAQRRSAESRKRKRSESAGLSSTGVALPNHSDIMAAIKAGLPRLRAIIDDEAAKPAEVLDAMRLLGQWAGLTRQSDRTADASPESRLAAAYRARGVEVPEHLRPFDKP